MPLPPRRCFLYWSNGVSLPMPCSQAIKSVALVSTISTFFFSSRRRHTMSPRDWSSDVCSSDLAAGRTGPGHGAARAGGPQPGAGRARGGRGGRYPQDAESTVYFCTLEALQNVAKHARASRATVTRSCPGTHLEFTVTDD